MRDHEAEIMRTSRRASSTASLALLLCSACGWHAGLGTPEGAHSIGVEAVERDGRVLERVLEPQLTDALSEAVVDWVDLPLVRPSQADLIVRGKVLEFRRRGGVRNRDNELVETAVFIRASAELIDRRTGKPAGPAVQAQEWSGFALDDPTNEDDARLRALRHVAVSLILALFEPHAEKAEGTAN
jgi:hypothetical protein